MSEQLNVCLIGGGNKLPMIKQALDAMYSPDVETSVLLVPTACSIPASYDKKVGPHKEMFTNLGVNVDILHAYGETPTPTELAEKFGNATIIFTIAGNSPYMMSNMKAHGSLAHIQQAATDKKMLAGTSAGALLPFAMSHSKPNAKIGEPFDYTYIPMADIIPAAAAVHAKIVDAPKTIPRLEDFANTIGETGLQYGLAMENDAGLLVVQGIAQIARSNPEANIHVVEPITPGSAEYKSRIIEGDSDMAMVYRAIQASRKS